MATEREAMMLAVEALRWANELAIKEKRGGLAGKCEVALAALRQAMGADTDSVYSGLALTEGEPGVKADPGWRFCSYCGCHTNAKARACCGLGRIADAPPWDSLVATASQHKKPPASASSTAVSGEEAPQRKAQPINAGKPWTEEDDAFIRSSMAAGDDRRDIAIALGRSRFGLEQRAFKLGLISMSGETFLPSSQPKDGEQL
jgi:hypothetical protein